MTRHAEALKTNLRTTGVHESSGWMNAVVADWRADLEASRNLTDLEKQNYGFVLAWFESWRLRLGLDQGRETAVRFWREQVKGKERKDWQLERWAEAMRWPGFAMLCRGKRGPHHEIISVVPFGKSPAGMTFQISLECHGFLMISERRGDFNPPRSKRLGAWSFPSIVFREPRLEISSDTNVMTVRFDLAAENVNILETHGLLRRRIRTLDGKLQCG